MFITSDKTVKFNVGGQVYEVSQSVLDMHPASMLAKSTSKLWKKESNIFIERDSARFHFVLDYMRDGKVTISVTESKETVMAELEYFGIEASEENINDTSARQIICKSAIIDIIKTLQEEADGDEVEYRFKCLTIVCLPSFDFELTEYDNKSVHLLVGKVSGGEMGVMEKVNARLQSVGLKFTKLKFSGRYYNLSMEVVKMN